MQSNISPPDAAPSAASHANTWSKTGRDGFKVQVAWNWSRGGHAVSGTVRDLRGGDALAFALDLRSPRSATVALVHADGERGTFIDVTLSLRRDGQRIVLKCNMPIAANEFFFDGIGEWPCPPDPAPDPDPYPFPDPHAGPGPDGEMIIDAPADSADLASFIWLPPLSDAETADAALRCVRCQVAAVRTLYDGLSPEHKLSTASAFGAGPAFVKDVALLAAPLSLFPAARTHFLALAGDQPLADLVADAQTQLALAALPAFLQEPACATAMAGVWQSVFALALVGTPSQAALGNGLLDILCVFHYLTLLDQGATALTGAAARRSALAAWVALPDSVAIRPPAPTIAGADAALPANSWEVLGAGMLKMARQHLAGYAPGELADVVNIMPRERQELVERSVATSASHERDDSAHTTRDDSSRATSASSELADTVREVMAADGMGADLSGMTPAYENLNMVLKGTGSNSKARSGWSSGDSARMVRRLTEQAAKRLGERISSQRGKEWQELRERRQSQLIDNTGNERLVGVYRWVDRVVRVHVQECGARIVLAFVLDQPARAWQAALAAQGNAPLQQPAPLPPKYSAISPANYQDLGAQYGLLGLEAPPPDKVLVSATVSQVTLGDAALLCVPDGYTVTSATVTVAISDDTFNLACSVCGVDLPAAPASGTLPAQSVPAPLSTVLPACSPTGTGPVAVDPCPRPKSAVSTLTIANPPVATGRIPLMVMSGAPFFCVTVVLTCSVIAPAAGAANALLTAWQLRIYQVLQAAWLDAWQRYEAAMRARSEQASAGQAGEVQRDTLKRACMDLLLQVAGKAGPSERTLEPALDWPHMTWQYQSPTSAAGNDWRDNPASEATRPSSERLFQRFLGAQSAQVLVPVSQGWENGLLCLLQCQQLWIGGPARAPVMESTMPLMEELIRPERAPRHGRHWTIRVPTSMIYLQHGASLPSMQRAAAPAAAREPAA